VYFVLGILRAVGVEHPKEHGVSDALSYNLEKFPDRFPWQTAYPEEGSEWLAERRGPSMYGDEIAGKPASELFKAEDSEKTVAYADRARELAMRLLHEMFGSR